MSIIFVIINVLQFIYYKSINYECCMMEDVVFNLCIVKIKIYIFMFDFYMFF